MADDNICYTILCVQYNIWRGSDRQLRKRKVGHKTSNKKNRACDRVEQRLLQMRGDGHLVGAGSQVMEGVIPFLTGAAEQQSSRHSLIYLFIVLDRFSFPPTVVLLIQTSVAYFFRTDSKWLCLFQAYLRQHRQCVANKNNRFTNILIVAMDE